MKTVVTILLLFSSTFVFSQTENINKAKNAFAEFHKNAYPDLDDTITCQLEHISIVIYKDGKIVKKAYKEKALSSSVFTGLQSDKPKAIKPDKIDLIKIKEFNGVYWLLSPKGTTATVLFIIDTKNKVMIQQRSASLGENFYGQSWLGRCI